uniref:Uncharacterized protein n=1 Tax=Glossina pallidipes TaxID=7398 RepID=A0A1A9Z436_GLOPL
MDRWNVRLCTGYTGAENQGKIRSAFEKRLVTILKIKRNSKYKRKAVDTWAIPVYTCSFGVVKWNGTDLDQANGTIRASMYKYNVHHPRSPKVRIYLPRQLGGRGLEYLSSLHDAEVTNLRKYFRSQRECRITEMMKLDRNYTPLNLISSSPETPNTQTIHHQMLCNWTQKQLHRNHANKKEEDTCIRTVNQRHIMNREIEPDLYRKCRNSRETIDHIIAGYIRLASTAYLNRCNQVCKILHQALAKKHSMQIPQIPYYKYQPAPVMNQNENATVCRPITTDHPINANKPDIVVLSWENKAVDIMDVSIPQNTRTTYSNKIVNYTELAPEIKGMYNVEKFTFNSNRHV